MIARALLLGDVVGEPGMSALERLLPSLRKELSPSIVVANGENASDGFGLDAACSDRIFAAGADVITTGNHVWHKRDFWPLLESHPRILRPANYPRGAPGKGLCIFPDPSGSFEWAVLNLQGREGMTPIDCPFKAADAIIAECPDTAFLVDFHAESTEEKEALALYLDGRVACFAGTHTHVQTADERVLPRGSARIGDLGMCGPADSVIGMKKEICVQRGLSMIHHKMEVATTKSRLCGVLVDYDSDSRKAVGIARIVRE